MTNTIQKVRTVVVVLMNSCQVSEKWKIGPVSAQMTTRATDPTRAGNDPAAVVTSSASRLNRSRSVGSGVAMNGPCAPRRYKRNAEQVLVVLLAIQTETTALGVGPRQHESRASADG